MHGPANFSGLALLAALAVPARSPGRGGSGTRCRGVNLPPPPRQIPGRASRLHPAPPGASRCSARPGERRAAGALTERCQSAAGRRALGPGAGLAPLGRDASHWAAVAAAEPGSAGERRPSLQVRARFAPSSPPGLGIALDTGSGWAGCVCSPARSAGNGVSLAAAPAGSSERSASCRSAAAPDLASCDSVAGWLAQCVLLTGACRYGRSFPRQKGAGSCKRLPKRGLFLLGSLPWGSTLPFSDNGTDPAFSGAGATSFVSMGL